MLKYVSKPVKKFLHWLDYLSPRPLLYNIVMSNRERLLFEETVKDARHYLEFGMGGSTLLALQISRAKVYTVESSYEWIEHMRKYLLIRWYERKRLFIFHANIGPTGRWGYPISNLYRDHFSLYSERVFHFIGKQNIDVVFIDGRFRVACALQVILRYNTNNLNILIHDFWNREYYHILLNYLEPLKKVDTLGLFAIRENINLNSVRKNYEIYKFDPR